jgi:hypothetical protein
MPTTNPAPADRRTSRNCRTCFSGAPTSFGLLEKLYCVLAIQTGRWPFAGAGLFHSPERSADIVRRFDLFGTVDFTRHGFDLFEQGRFVPVEQLEFCRFGIDCLDDLAGKVFCAAAAFSPMGADRHRYAKFVAVGFDRRQLAGCIGGKPVDGYHYRNAEFLQILDMAAKIGETGFQRAIADRCGLLQRQAAMHFQSTDSGNQHGGRRRKPGLTAFDVEEFLCAEVCPEPGFGDDIVRHLQRRLGRDDGVAAMGDVRERPAMDEDGIVLQCLHNIREQSVAQQRHDRAHSADVLSGDRHPAALVTDHDPFQPFFQIVSIFGEAENGHDLRSDRDVEAGFHRRAVSGAAKAGHDLAQIAVVHVQHAAPGNAGRFQPGFRAPVQMVVDHRRQQIVR